VKVKEMTESPKKTKLVAFFGKSEYQKQHQTLKMK